MSDEEFERNLALIQSPVISDGTAAMKALLYASREDDSVYRHFPALLSLLSSEDGTVRTRAILLIAHNIIWDKEDLFAPFCEEFLSHLSDPGNETAEHCIRTLSWIAAAKPEYKDSFISALEAADFTSMPDPEVLEKNREDTLKRLREGRR